MAAGADPTTSDRRDLQGLRARWLELTRRTLPGMAVERGWPIRLDHCFMRVCLDAAIGDRWDRVVPRPAIRHLSREQLACAVAVAERIVREPDSLPGLNARSLAMRGSGHARTSGNRRERGAL